MRFIRFEELRERGICYSRDQIRRLVKNGSFPSPVPLTDAARRKAWVELEVTAWMEGRAARRAESAAA